jgi:hypothetical protein
LGSDGGRAGLLRHRSAEGVLRGGAAVEVDVHLGGDRHGGVAHDLGEDVQGDASVCSPRREGVTQIVERQRLRQLGEIARGLEAAAIHVAMAEWSAVSGGKDEVAVLGEPRRHPELPQLADDVRGERYTPERLRRLRSGQLAELRPLPPDVQDGPVEIDVAPLEPENSPFRRPVSTAMVRRAE